ncbi:glycosyltransferase family 9 protein [Lonepinella koalarum]|nr:glycosyltransferase family 9 protein [Lonepinella koalarum]
MLIKKLMVIFWGSRKPTKCRDLSQVKSVLLNPIGDAIGDAIVHGLHLRQLKSRYPNLKIGVLVTDRNKVVFEASGLVDEFIQMTFINYCRQRKKWDLYLDFTPQFTSRALMLDKILAPQRVMIFSKAAKKYYSLDNIHNYDFYQPISPNTHLKDYLMHSDFAPELSGQAPEVYQLNLAEEVKQKAEKLWESDKVRILICPQGSSVKRLSPEECGRILQHIHVQSWGQIDIQLGYSAMNEEYLVGLKQFSSLPNVRASERTTVEQYLALVNSSDIVLAVDSGGVHVACALRKPLLAFYANFPSNIGKWGPYSQNMNQVEMLVGQSVASSADDTYGFDIEKAGKWLNQQIEQKLALM